MDVLSTAIKFFVKGVLDEASKRVAKRFDVSVDEAMDIWKDLQIDLDSIPSVKGISKSSNRKSNDSEEVECCSHILTRGPRKDEECGGKISQKSQTGHYCSVHLIQENKTKSKVVAAKKEEKKDKKNTTGTKEKKDEKEEVIIRKDPNYGRYVHSGTGFVFKSAQEKIVVGVQDEDGDVRKLTPDDINLCKKYRFVFDMTAVETPEKKSEEEKSEEEKSEEDSNDESDAESVNEDSD